MTTLTEQLFQVERLGYALEPQELFEVTRAGGGVEDLRRDLLSRLL